MKQKFYENTIQSKYIKALLSSIYIPVMDTIKPGMLMVKDTLYATRRYIVKCTKTGIFMYEEIGTETEEELESIKATFDVVTEYIFGSYYPKFTECYVPTTDYYDTETHEWLGKVLRVYSDLIGIDLMPFYNMYSDNYVPNIRIEKTGVSSLVDNTIKTIKIPMKFNRTYTIAIDCSSQVWCCPCFLAKDNFLIMKHEDGTQENINETFFDTYSDMDYIKLNSNTSFKQPFTYSVSCSDSDYLRYERDLYLLIQLPASNNSSIVVLEGDYTSLNKEIIVNNEYSDYFSDASMNNVLLTNLSLLQFNNKESYPFADRLIEYLLGGVVTKEEVLKYNVARIQDRMQSGFLTDHYVRGVWNDFTRTKVYQGTYKSVKVSNLDINGYVDKDTEKLFGD